MKKHFLIITLVTFFSVGFISSSTKASVTIATFADPSANSSDSLFTVDFTQMTLTGGWSDAKTGLTLEVPSSGYTIEAGNAFQDVWFEMSTVEITSVSGMLGETGYGVINFYADGTSTDALITIIFESGTVSRYGLGADEIFVANSVTITGSAIIGTLTEEYFAFSFANLVKLLDHTKWTDGFTATAAFTSSAVVDTTTIPEPATISLLGFSALSLLRKKK